MQFLVLQILLLKCNFNSYSIKVYNYLNLKLISRYKPIFTNAFVVLINVTEILFFVIVLNLFMILDLNFVQYYSHTYNTIHYTYSKLTLLTLHQLPFYSKFFLSFCLYYSDMSAVYRYPSFIAGSVCMYFHEFVNLFFVLNAKTRSYTLDRIIFNGYSLDDTNILLCHSNNNCNLNLCFFYVILTNNLLNVSSIITTIDCLNIKLLDTKRADNINLLSVIYYCSNLRYSYEYQIYLLFIIKKYLLSLTVYIECELFSIIFIITYKFPEVPFFLHPLKLLLILNPYIGVLKRKKS